MRYIFSLFIGLAIFSAMFTSCSGEQRAKLAVTPTSYGKVDHIMVVTDKYNWTTAIGDTFRNSFEALYPVTPQPEPIYDLRHKTGLEFEEGKILKTHRAIVIIGALDDKDSKTSAIIRNAIGEKNVKRATEQNNYRIAVHKNRWAQGQTVIYWFGPNRTELLKTIAKDYQRVMNEFNKADTEMYIEQIYLPGQDLESTALITETFGANLQIPREYFLAHNDSTAIWVRKETNKISSNIFIYSIPLSDSTQLTPEDHKRIRNNYTKKYFATRIEDSYMQIDDRIYPIFYQKMQFDGKETLQARGLWGMVNDFMGGSFVTYMIKDTDNNRMIILDGFVHAPGQKKRPEMRKLDMIFSTFKSLK